MVTSRQTFDTVCKIENVSDPFAIGGKDDVARIKVDARIDSLK
jgi:hypothetical protein